MARFSVDGEEESSNPTRHCKRPRTSAFRVRISEPSSASADEDDDRDDDDAEEEEEEEESERDDVEQETVGNSCNSVRRQSGSSTRSGAVSIKLSDPDVLDCAICCEPLSPPVYQCDNGHIACSCCCTKIRNKCPFCQLPIGYNRCRAMEKVLQSIIISCKNAEYGCQEVSCYSRKIMHEKKCVYAPFSCPFTDCSFFGSRELFIPHLSNDHSTYVMGFLYDSVYHICLQKTDEIMFLEEETEGDLFILSCGVVSSGSTHIGNVVAVHSIGSGFSNAKFQYDLLADNAETSIKMHSVTNRIGKLLDKFPATGYLVVPAEFFNSVGSLTLKLTVWQNGTSRMDV